MRKSVDLCEMCFSYVMDELTVFEAHRFSKHLKRCMRCRKEHAELLDLRAQAEHEFGATDVAKLCLHPFYRPAYWWAASAMALLIGLSISLPHHSRLIGKMRETATDMMHASIADKVADFDLAAHRMLRAPGEHPSLRIPHI